MRLDRCYLLVLTLVTTLLPALSLSTNTLAKETDIEMPIGGVGGTVHADPFTGMATMSISIEVPPSRNGVLPNLALTYASSNGNGWVGIGWKLEMGTIERQTRFGVDYTKNDYVIRLNGMSTELIQAPPPAASDEYRAKFEGGFLRMKKLASGGWEVTDKRGTKYLFGTTATTRVADPGNASVIFRWCLERIEDRDGNYLTATYVSDQGQEYLDQIQYAGNGTTAPTNSVKFYRENRPDVSDMYTVNFRIRTAFRLKAIEVKASGNLVRVYKLAYDQAAQTSVLQSIQQVGKDATVDVNGNVTGGTVLPAFTISAPRSLSDIDGRAACS